MSQHFSLFDRLQSPVWVFDIDHKRIIWANQASLPLWESSSTEELVSRDLAKDMSQAVHAILEEYQQYFQRGEHIKTWWNFNPKQKQKKALCCFSGFTLDDGRMAMLVEVIADESTLRRELAFAECSNLALLFECQAA
ncbi:hypothetical protein AB733_00575 [Photobacterium swingsii]|nr:hypothetical protein AB733_00575 [Photobacterium swingsii]